MRLIDAEALKTIKSIQSADFNSIETIRRWIDSAPTIDTIIDIVRCKDCKHRDKFGCHNPIWGDGWANYPSPSTKDTDFCSYGERSEE